MGRKKKTPKLAFLCLSGEDALINSHVRFLEQELCLEGLTVTVHDIRELDKAITLGARTVIIFGFGDEEQLLTASGYSVKRNCAVMFVFKSCRPHKENVMPFSMQEGLNVFVTATSSLMHEGKILPRSMAKSK